MSDLEEMTWDEVLNGKANDRILVLEDKKGHKKNYILNNVLSETELYCYKIVTNPRDNKSYALTAEVTLNDCGKVIKEILGTVYDENMEKEIIERLKKFKETTA